jgi:pentatricopeptide repeat protein
LLQVVHAKQLTRLLGALARLRDSERSSAAVRWAAGRGGLEVNVIHYSKLVSTLGRCDGWAAADAAFRDMLNAGVEPDTVREIYKRVVGGRGGVSVCGGVFGLPSKCHELCRMERLPSSEVHPGKNVAALRQLCTSLNDSGPTHTLTLTKQWGVSSLDPHSS